MHLYVQMQEIFLQFAYIHFHISDIYIYDADDDQAFKHESRGNISGTSSVRWHIFCTLHLRPSDKHTTNKPQSRQSNKPIPQQKKRVEMNLQTNPKTTKKSTKMTPK